MSARVHLGISTCPNDTFAFHGILCGAISSPRLELEIELLDVQELNEGLARGAFDVAKGSYHAALLHAEELWVLPSGSALGYGVGPLLLAARPGEQPAQPASESPARVLCPGEHTTAHLLYRLFHAGEGQIEQVVFSEILPRLERGEADFGVCIHEGRFTWQNRGLGLVEDLGSRWERECGGPLPLGGLFARRSIGAPLAREVQSLIRASLEYGHAHRAQTLESMRRYAAEQADEVLFAHVDLYVNDWTLELGSSGRSALEALSQRARAAGWLPTAAAGLEVLSP